MVNFKPLYDHVLLKKDDREETLAGGILLPKAAQDESDCATVIAVGHGRLMIDGSIVPLLVKAGDKVRIHKMDGTELKFNGVEYILTKEVDIFGIVESN